MQTLKDEGFFGAGLLAVRTPSMVKRYNRCLEDIGVEPTKCKSFQIDGMGWSPQIAEEKENARYLSHGEANQFAIILSPDQEGKPIYAPSHSFDFKLMSEVFRLARQQIANLTAETALWLDIDQQIDHYHSPLDLLMIESITIKTTSIDRIILEANKQRNMVAAFRDENDLWLDGEARKKLIESAEKYGDLRFKPCIIPNIPFVDLRSFHTQAFGGAFVFRDLPGFFNDQIIVIESTGKYSRLIATERSVFGIDQVELYSMLEKFKLAQTKAAWLIDNLHAFDELKEELLAEALYKTGTSDFDLANATSAQKKRAVAEVRDLLPEEYFEIDETKRLAESERLTDRDISKKLRRLLTRPHHDLSEEMKSLVWMTLMKMNPISVEMLYRHSKQQFFRVYESWPPQRRKWAVARLKAKGLPNTK